jgi:hypothetical protein
MIYSCCDEQRREAVGKHATLNGIDYLEVLDSERPLGSPRQRTLFVHLLKPVPVPTAANIMITGGERITPIKVEWVDVASAPPAQATAQEKTFFTGLPDAAKILVVRTNVAGDFSTYTLRLVTSPANLTPPKDFDRLLSRIDFSFRIECPSDVDCKPQRICVDPSPFEPDIDYLAKDYASFRRLMLDRMIQSMPGWNERSPADLGITLVELLAYVGDHLSYRQDAIATEAYLATARKRISVRRHARLVDYRMHDGCNARAWVQIQVSANGVQLPRGTQLLSQTPGFPALIPLPATAGTYDQVMRTQPVVFETMHDAKLFSDHNEMKFYSWGDQECCLPKGATRATLRKNLTALAPGDVVVFEEVLCPRTGRGEDADVRRRHAVRLVDVVADEGGNPLVDQLNNTPITEIAWSDDDALPFALCISARTDPEHGKVFNDAVSVARGNIVLADHGRGIAAEPLGTVPKSKVFLTPEPGADRCEPRDRVAVPPRFRPTLAFAPLTQAAPYDPKAEPMISANAAMHWSLDAAMPSLELQRTSPRADRWTARRDVLDSGAADTHFVAEVESDGSTTLRFGNDRQGMRPDSGDVFIATYRVGNGVAGKVGAEALAHAVTNQAGISLVRNPLPAQGGTEPETAMQVRTRAPFAFRTQERAVTPSDYAEVSERNAQVQKAAATFRWTGSWQTVFVTIDRAEGLPVDDAFEAEMRRHIEPYRMAGYDLEIDAPHFVPLEIDMQVCVKPEYFRSDVKAALVDLFSSNVLRDEQRGLFHPDNFTFGQTVYLSRLYAAAQAVQGVESVAISKFERQGVADDRPLAEGRLDVDRLEIARLDNSRNDPDRGVFRLQVGGGK